MRTDTIFAKSFMTKSKLNDGFTCNPYVGCTHGCHYCYAKTLPIGKHSIREWGEFVDIKIYPNYNIPRNTGSARLLFSSATDPYQPIEATTESTRKIFDQIKESILDVSVLTKSTLVLRDVDVFRKMQHIEVGFSISLPDIHALQLEPGASLPSERMKAAQTLHENQIKTYVFIAPIFPYLTDVFGIIESLRNTVDYFMFDTLNLSHPDNRDQIFGYIRTHHPDLWPAYKEIFLEHNRRYYRDLRLKIMDYMKKEKLAYTYLYE